MTKDQAIKFRDEWISKGARDFTKPSHFELPELLEVHIEAVAVTYDDFHDLQGGVKYPKKETIDKFGMAAGVSYNSAVENGTRKEDDVFVGRSQGMTMGPDGQPIMGDVCEYEFDPELRAEEDILRDTKNKYTNDTTKRLLVLQYKKVGRQRANTGARSRATLAVLGIQTGFKDLKPKETFLFSRVMVNTKNQLLAQAMIGNLAGNTRALFGGSDSQPRLVAGTVTKVQEAGPEAGAAQDDDLPDFDPETPPDPVKLKKAALIDLLDKYPGKISPEAADRSRKIAEHPDTTEETLDKYLEAVKATLERQNIKVGA